VKTYFDQERLDVYQESIAFCGWVGDFLNEITAKAAAKDRASTSLPLNIADGNSKLSTTDGARFLEIARGSAVECAACLDVLAARKFVSPDRITPAKEQLVRIVNRLTGMLTKFSSRAEFLREDEGPYAIEHEQEHE